jgi:hypothetical protein
MQILILGMHRSGTSALTRIIHMMGAYFAPEEFALPANSANPKGFWERKDVVQVNNELLQYQNCNWLNVFGWNSDRTSFSPPKIMQHLTQIIGELDAHKPWAIKDPRLCMTLPCWLPFLKTPIAVIMARDPLEAARSLQLRDGVEIAHGLALWEYYAVGVVRAAAALPKIFIGHEELMGAPLSAVQRLHQELSVHVSGLSLPLEQAVLSFVDPSLHRAKLSDVDADVVISPHQQSLYAMLSGQKPFDENVAVSVHSERVMQISPRTL